MSHCTNWNSTTDHICSLEGTLAINHSLYLPFCVLPLDHYEAVSRTSEQRRYENTPVSTSSRSQAVIKLYCWHNPIRRSYKSYTKKNILMINIVLGKTKRSKLNLFRWNIPLKNLSRGMYPTWKTVIQMA